MKTRSGVLTIAVIVALAGMMATPAHATLTVIVNGTNNGTAVGGVTGGTTFTDGVGGDTNLTPNVLTFSFADVQFSIQGLTATSASPAQISMTMIGNATATSPVMTLAISNNGFTIPAVPLTLSETLIGLAASGGPTANLSAIGYFGSNNALFNTAGPSTSTATAGLDLAAGFGSSGAITVGSPYSLTEWVTVNILTTGSTDNSMQVNANLNAVPVPEPASILGLSTVLFLVGLRLRRKIV